jgi:hypothetical protein
MSCIALERFHEFQIGTFVANPHTYLQAQHSSLAFQPGHHMLVRIGRDHIRDFTRH